MGARLPHGGAGDGRPSQPASQPGVSMAELVEEVELQLRLAGSRTPSFATHIFTGLDPGQPRLDAGDTARAPMPEGTSVMFDFGGVVDGVLLGLRPHRGRGGAVAGAARRVRR